MSGQFDTESGGTVGIYKAASGNQVLMTRDSHDSFVATCELTEDELYRLIYKAAPELRCLVNYAKWIATDAGFSEVSNGVRQDLVRIGQQIPTESDITKRRRAAQRTAKQ